MNFNPRILKKKNLIGFFGVWIYLILLHFYSSHLSSPAQPLKEIERWLDLVTFFSLSLLNFIYSFNKVRCPQCQTLLAQNWKACYRCGLKFDSDTHLALTHLALENRNPVSKISFAGKIYASISLKKLRDRKLNPTQRIPGNPDVPLLPVEAQAPLAHRSLGSHVLQVGIEQESKPFKLIPRAPLEFIRAPLLLAGILICALSTRPLLSQGLPLTRHSSGHDFKKVSDLGSAIDKNDVNRVATLLSEGVDPNVSLSNQSERKLTPLIAAVCANQIEIADELLAHGASENDAISDQNELLNPILLATSSNNLEMTKLLLRFNANLNIQNSQGETPLMLATEGDAFDIVIQLVSAGADLNLKNKKGETAIMLAVKKRHTSIVQYLRLKGANLDAVDQGGNSALNSALKENSPEIIQALDGSNSLLSFASLPLSDKLSE